MPQNDSTASMDEAMRCYKCSKTGVEIDVKPAREKHQGKVHIIECRNELCINYEQRWMVQVRPDGTIPIFENSRKSSKSFPKMSVSGEALARRGIEDAIGKRFDEQ